jgi:hypothetical protein
VTPASVFSLANTFALLGWLLLIFAGRLRWVADLVTGFIVPLILAGLYAVLIAGHWSDPGGGGFGSLAEVAQLFANPWKLLAGWVHYLAFDLFVGSWEARDAREKGVPHWLIAPALFFTFLFGPAGLLLYFGTREGFTRSGGRRPDPAAQP